MMYNLECSILRTPEQNDLRSPRKRQRYKHTISNNQHVHNFYEHFAQIDQKLGHTVFFFSMSSQEIQAKLH